MSDDLLIPRLSANILKADSGTLAGHNGLMSLLGDARSHASLQAAEAREREGCRGGDIAKPVYGEVIRRSLRTAT